MDFYIKNRPCPVSDLDPDLQALDATPEKFYGCDHQIRISKHSEPLATFEGNSFLFASVAGDVLDLPFFANMLSFYHCAAYIGIGGMKIEDEPRH